MTNIFDYAEQNNDKPVCIENFNELDGLSFALCSYISFTNVKLNSTIKESIKNIIPPEKEITEFRSVCNLFFRNIANGSRYGDAKILNYEEILNPNIPIQFAAVTFLLPSGLTIVSFRGTDNTIIGWKEDFSLSFASSVPAQERAAAYLKDTCQNTDGPVIVTGHSKGGNLAVYSFLDAECDYRDNVKKVFSFDGPGFNEHTLASFNFIRDSKRILTLVPQSSVVGMLLEHTEPIEVILSNGLGAFQHNPFKWHIVGDSFVRVTDKDPSSRVFDKTIRLWLESVDDKQKEEFINELFNALTDGGIHTVKEMLHKPETLYKLAKAYSSSTEKNKENINFVLGKFFRSAGKSISQRLKFPKSQF